MITKAIWDFRIASDIIHSDDTKIVIEDLIDAVNYARNDGCMINCCDDFYYEVVDGVSFSDWLYDKNTPPNLIEVKRELAISLSRGTPITRKDYDETRCAIETQDVKECLSMALHISKESILYIFDIQRYLEAKQWYLSEFVNQDRFVDEAIECFPNLVFHENVSSSINTLNAEFRIVRPFIVKHLCALNKYQQDTSLSKDSTIGFREIASKIQELYSIECSTQSGRDSAEDLYYTFKDEETGVTDKVCCELHTKLKWKDMDKENQDRIYFHPGKEDMCNKKILIAHIGTHK